MTTNIPLLTGERVVAIAGVGEDLCILTSLGRIYRVKDTGLSREPYSGNWLAWEDQGRKE